MIASDRTWIYLLFIITLPHFFSTIIYVQTLLLMLNYLTAINTAFMTPTSSSLWQCILFQTRLWFSYWLWLNWTIPSSYVTSNSKFTLFWWDLHCTNSTKIIQRSQYIWKYKSDREQESYDSHVCINAKYCQECELLVAFYNMCVLPCSAATEDNRCHMQGLERSYSNTGNNKWLPVSSLKSQISML